MAYRKGAWYVPLFHLRPASLRGIADINQEARLEATLRSTLATCFSACFARRTASVEQSNLHESSSDSAQSATEHLHLLFTGKTPDSGVSRLK